MGEVQNVNASTTTLAGDYALATSLNAATDPTMPASWVPLGTTLQQQGDQANPMSFSGIFEGLGHTVSNLTISMIFNEGSSGTSFVGMFGVSTGTIRDFGLVGGSVTTSILNCFNNCTSLVGDLVGQMGDGGVIANAYATGSVSSAGGGGANYTGGLVGLMAGLDVVVGDYATGAVTGNAFTGGLVGAEYDTLVTNSYATGAVSGGSYVGGLVGYLSAPAHISDSYSTGRVAGGGLVGFAEAGPGNTTDSYWDTQTSGQTGSDGGTGMTTAQLQAGLPTGFSPSVWGQVAGKTYPYLLSFMPTAPAGQLAVTGVVYGASPGSVLSGVEVVVVLNGSSILGTATTGANGAYSVSALAGTLSAGDTITVYLVDGSVLANTVAEDIGGTTVTGLNLVANTLLVRSPDTSLTSLEAALAAGLGSATTAAKSEFLFGYSGGALSLQSGAGLDLAATGAGFAFDENLNVGSGMLKVASAGAVSQTAGGIVAADLQGVSLGGAMFKDAGNKIADVIGWSDTSGAFALTDAAALSVTGMVKASDGVDLTTTAGDLTLLRGLVASDGGVSLHSAGDVDEAAGLATIDAKGSLSVTSVSGESLRAGNKVAAVSLSNTGSGAVGFRGLGTLRVGTADAANAGALTLIASTGFIDLGGAVTGGRVDLSSTAGVAEVGHGVLTANVLTGASGGAVTLGGANRIVALGPFSDTSGPFTLVDDETLHQRGLFNAAGQYVSLSTRTGGIAIVGTIVASTLDLYAKTGALTESSTLGTIDVFTLNAVANTGITLTSPNNAIATIGTNHTNSGPDEITQ
jgi:hypothetical protein